MIERKDGERSFLYWRDSSAARLLADDEAALDRAIGGAASVLLSGITLAILAPDRRAALIARLAQATRDGALTAFDPNIRPRLWEDPDAMRACLTEAAAACAVVLPSFDDERAAFGDADLRATAARYRALGPGEVVVKDGARPALVSTSGRETDVAAEAGPPPLDTTGAGDAFGGGYLASRLSGDAPETAARRAHRVAAESVRHLGALVPMETLRAVWRAA